MPHVNEQLSSAIEQLYKVFDRYKLADEIVGCDHCVSHSDIANLRAASLRHLTSQNLGRFAFKTMTTWGNPNDFRHFLPRILELLAIDGPFMSGAIVDTEAVIGKLNYGDWRQWPADEQAAVTEYLLTLWKHVLSQYPHPLSPATLLCAIGQSFDDLSDFLAQWEPDSLPQHALHLADCMQVLKQFKGRLEIAGFDNAFWKTRKLQLQQISDWVKDPRRLEEMECAFFRFSDSATEASECLSRACENMKSLIASRNLELSE